MKTNITYNLSGALFAYLECYLIQYMYSLWTLTWHSWIYYTDRWMVKKGGNSIMLLQDIVVVFRFWRYLTRELNWHLSQSSIRPSIYFSSIVNTRSNPFLELNKKVNVSCSMKHGLSWGSNPRPPHYESDVQPTAPRRPLNNITNAHWLHI